MAAVTTSQRRDIDGSHLLTCTAMAVGCEFPHRQGKAHYMTFNFNTHSSKNNFVTSTFLIFRRLMPTYAH